MNNSLTSLSLIMEMKRYLINQKIKGAIVNRSYSDFEWLFNALYENFPGIIVPSIPTRSVLAKLNISTLTASIRAQRQKGLEEFLRKV